MFQPVSPHELEDFFAYIVSVLERLNIPYMVVGGFAAITYGELRFTADVDIVVNMQYGHVDPFVAAFPIPDYYVSREGVWIPWLGDIPSTSSSRIPGLR